MVTAGKLSWLSLVSVIEVAIGSRTSRMISAIVTVQNPPMAITMITPQNMRLSHDLLAKMYRAPLNVESLKNFLALHLQLGLVVSSPFSWSNVPLFSLIFNLIEDCMDVDAVKKCKLKSCDEILFNSSALIAVQYVL